MRSKNRIIATVISMVMVVAVLCVGIYAAATLKFTGNGTITYTSSDVHASVSVTQKGVEKLDPNDFDQTTVGEPYTDTVTLDALTISSSQKTVSYTITVKSNFVEAAQSNVHVVFNSTISGTDAGLFTSTATGTNGSTTVTLTDLNAGVDVTFGQTLTFTVTVTLSDTFNWQQAINATYGFDLTLTRAVAA